MSTRSTNSLKEKLNEIVDSTTDPEKIDISNISKILSDPKINYIDAKQAVSFLISSMLKTAQKSSVCLELLQYMISMCKTDILEILSVEAILIDLKNVITKGEPKQFKLDLMDFLENIYNQHQFNNKYSGLINLIKLYRKNRNITDNTTSNNKPNDDEIDEDIQRAIRLSLETCPDVNKNFNNSINSNNNVNTNSNISMGSSIKSTPTDVPYTSVVLFDFDAEEPGELSVRTGETITVLEKCNESWWKGQVGNRVGLFPSNFVSSKSGDPNLIMTTENIINEDTMNRCLMMLVDADPIYANENECEIKDLEGRCKKMDVEVKKHLDKLKNKNQKYAELDKEYNEVIQSYLELIEKSRAINDPARQQPYQYSQPQGFVGDGVYRIPGPYEPQNYGDPYM